MDSQDLTWSCEDCGFTHIYAGDSCPNCGSGGPDEVAGDAVEVDQVRVIDPEDVAVALAGIDAMIRLSGAKPIDVPAETPNRALSAFMASTEGYELNPEEVLQNLSSLEGESCEEIIVLRRVRFTSICELHLLQFSGLATVGYVPGKGGAVVNLSEMSKLVTLYSRRLQGPERLTVQIAEALEKHLAPAATGCIVTVSNPCIACRGVDLGAEMVTSAMYGRFKESPVSRAELFALAL